MLIRSTLILFFSILVFKGMGQEYKEWFNSSDIKVSDIIANAEDYLAQNPSEKERKLFERWKYNALRQQDENGYLRSQEDIIRELERFIAEKETIGGGESFVANWQEIGPMNWNATSGYNPGVGRITSFAHDPTNPNIVIAGSQTGGIWRSIDQGSTWTPLLDNFTDMRVYALSVDPQTPTTYYWGGRFGRIYKSTDSGTTWTNLTTLSGGGNVNKILIDPTNSSRMFVTSRYNGFFISTNGGATWTEPLAEGTAYDVEFKPGDLNTIYVGGDNFHKSTNGGTSWSTIGGFDNTGAKMIGVSANNANRVYVIESTGSAFNGIYVSNDSGTSFTKKTHTQNFFGYNQAGDDLTAGQAPRDMGIAISPTNADEVHIAGINTWRSTDGGDSFIPTSRWTFDGAGSYCHADVDDLLFMGSTLVVLSDGGVYFAANPSAAPSPTFYTDKSTGMGTHQFYKIGVSQTSTAVITGGSQDNGSSTFTGSLWRNWFGADGMEGFVDKNNTNLLYGTVQFGDFYKSTDGGLSVMNVSEPTGVGQGNWVTPFEQDPIVTNTIYCGFEEVHKSTDGGNTWAAISQNFGANIDNLKIAPSDNNIMFASEGGSLYKTTTGSGTWTTLSGFSGNINSIAIHPTDANKVAIATSGAAKVYISNDGGATWTANNTGLPGFSALCLVWQNSVDNCLYLGMDYGVYYISDALTSWVNYSTLLPNVQVNELEINNAEGKIYAATYGRGLWKSDLHAPLVPVELGEFKAKLEEKTNTVQLSWFTLSEIDNDYFLVQKSTDGLNWTDLARVTSKGNSLERKNYGAIDISPAPGLNYYRLIDVDLSGKKGYSKVISVNLTKVDLLSIYPNPSKGRFLLYTDAAKASVIEILVYNAAGVLVESKIEKVELGLRDIAVELNVDSGIYFLTMKVDGVSLHEGKRLVVER